MVIAYYLIKDCPIAKIDKSPSDQKDEIAIYKTVQKQEKAQRRGCNDN